MPGSYPYKQIFAIDPSNPDNVARNADILIFAPGDASRTLLVITDISSGRALPNPVRTNEYGFSNTFTHATLPQVTWEGVGFSDTFESYRGLKDDAMAAANAAQLSSQSAESAASEAASTVTASLAGAVADAEAAKVAAQAAAGHVGAPAGAAVVAAVSPSGAADEVVLSARIVASTEEALQEGQ